MPNLLPYTAHEPRSGSTAWYVCRVAIVEGGLTEAFPWGTKVVAPVGHTVEVRANHRRKQARRTQLVMDLLTAFTENCAWRMVARLQEEFGRY